MSVHFSSKDEGWLTPQPVIDAVLDCFGGTIDLDPCSNSHESPNVPAAMYLTKEDDGLSLTHRWRGKVYMNPPYGRGITRWVSKLLVEYYGYNIVEAIALLPARPDTVWFNNLYRYPWCAVRGRLRFGSAERAPFPAPFPSAVFYIGPEQWYDRFARTFSKLGQIWTHWV